MSEKPNQPNPPKLTAVGKNRYAVQSQGAKGGRITIPQAVLNSWGIKSTGFVYLWWMPEYGGILITPGKEVK